MNLWKPLKPEFNLESWDRLSRCVSLLPLQPGSAPCTRPPVICLLPHPFPHCLVLPTPVLLLGVSSCKATGTSFPPSTILQPRPSATGFSHTHLCILAPLPQTLSPLVALSKGQAGPRTFLVSEMRQLTCTCLRLVRTGFKPRQCGPWGLLTTNHTVRRQAPVVYFLHIVGSPWKCFSKFYVKIQSNKSAESYHVEAISISIT